MKILIQKTGNLVAGKGFVQFFLHVGNSYLRQRAHFPSHKDLIKSNDLGYFDHRLYRETCDLLFNTRKD